MLRGENVTYSRQNSSKIDGNLTFPSNLSKPSLSSGVSIAYLLRTWRMSVAPELPVYKWSGSSKGPSCACFVWYHSLW
jgi:hypothetical protein